MTKQAIGWLRTSPLSLPGGLLSALRSWFGRIEDGSWLGKCDNKRINGRAGAGDAGGTPPKVVDDEADGLILNELR